MSRVSGRQFPAFLTTVSFAVKISANMKLSMATALFVLLLFAACRTTGVEISDEQLSSAIGLTEEQLTELYGTPHMTSLDSAGVQLIGYGVEHYWGLSLDATTIVEFTLVDGSVVKTRRMFERPIANKNRAR